MTAVMSYVRWVAEWLKGQWILRRGVALVLTFAAIFVGVVYIVPAIFDPDFPELPLPVATAAALYAVAYAVRP